MVPPTLWGSNCCMLCKGTALAYCTSLCEPENHKPVVSAKALCETTKLSLTSVGNENPQTHTSEIHYFLECRTLSLPKQEGGMCFDQNEMAFFQQRNFISAGKWSFPFYWDWNRGQAICTMIMASSQQMINGKCMLNFHWNKAYACILLKLNIWQNTLLNQGNYLTFLTKKFKSSRFGLGLIYWHHVCISQYKVRKKCTLKSTAKMNGFARKKLLSVYVKSRKGYEW